MSFCLQLFVWGCCKCFPAGKNRICWPTRPAGSGQRILHWKSCAEGNLLSEVFRSVSKYWVDLFVCHELWRSVVPNFQGVKGGYGEVGHKGCRGQPVSFFSRFAMQDIYTLFYQTYISIRWCFMLFFIIFFCSQGDPGSGIHSKGQKGDRGPEGSEVRYDKPFIPFSITKVPLWCCMKMYSTSMHHIPSVLNEIIAASHVFLFFSFFFKQTKTQHELCPTEGANEALKEPEFALI